MMNAVKMGIALGGIILVIDGFITLIIYLRSKKNEK